MSSRSAHMPNKGVSSQRGGFEGGLGLSATASGVYFIRMRLGAPYREITMDSPVSITSDAREQKSRLVSAMLNVFMVSPYAQQLLHIPMGKSRSFWEVSAA